MKKVLVVEDDASMRDLLVMVFKDAGYEVSEADGGVSGLKRVQEDPPDVIVTDLGMPDLGGFEFLRTLQQGDTVRIPVIILTAKRMPPAAIREMQHEPNVKAYLVKPLQHTKLLAEVSRILQGR
ncbi:MAG: response regulator [Elusimicrobiota bacterium]